MCIRDRVITFNQNIFGRGQVINLASQLPALKNTSGNPITIDGWSATKPGYKDGPLVVLDGSAIKTENVDGLTILSKDNIIRGLAISGFTGNGLVIHGADATGNWINGDDIGTSTLNADQKGNGKAGILIDAGAANNVIGVKDRSTTPPPRITNIITGNGGGILITGSGTSQNSVTGNYIGTTADDLPGKGNKVFGVQIEQGAAGNIIGVSPTLTTLTPDLHNIIAGNNGDGVVITDSGTTGNQITDNYIGVKDTGIDSLKNDGNGVLIKNGAQANYIGSTAKGVSRGLSLIHI